MDIFPAFALAVAGLVFGSFLNVCISRIPRDESVVSPGSHCPHCSHPVRWYHNVPLFGYLVLGGKCADCAQPISLRYLAVELLTAILFVACYAKFGPSLALLKFAIFCFLLIGLIFMDAETGLLVHEFTYPGIAVGLLFTYFVPVDSSGSEFLLQLAGRDPALTVRGWSLLDAVLAALLGAAFFYVMWALYYLVRKRHGLGFGDIALMAMCGIFLGLKLTVFVVVLAPLAGSLFALLLLARHAATAHEAPPEEASQKDASQQGDARLSTREMLQQTAIPFGVFLGSAAIIAIFWGESAWNVYLRFVLHR